MAFNILKKSGNASDNLWSFYTENGVLYTTSDGEAAAAKLQTLITTTPVGDLRLVENIDITLIITLPTEETPPEPDTGEETP